MSGAPFGEAGGRLLGGVAALLRVDRWPARIRPWLERARETFAFASRRAREVRLAQVASSLTFTTTLSIVPLAAVALSVFAAFPLFDEYRAALEKLLLREMLPPQISATSLRYLHDFSAKATGLTAFGLLFLLITALLMISTVDRALNDVWRVQRRRGLLARILVYWALLSLGPLTIGASLSASSYLLALSRPMGVLRPLLDVGPFFLGGLALATLYVLVPNRKVAWDDAFIGGFVASALGEALTFGFGLYIRTGTIASIYGAFAVVPLFLLWVYLSWYALLFGAAIAATLPALRATRFSDEGRTGNRFVTALALLRTLLRAREQGANEGRLDVRTLAVSVRAPVEEVEPLLVDLERLGYASRLGGAHRGAWLLTCDPGRATLRPLFERLAVDPENSLLSACPEVGRWLESGLRADWLQQPLATALSRGGATEGRA